MAHSWRSALAGTFPQENTGLECSPGYLRVAWEPVVRNGRGGEAERRGHLLASSRAEPGSVRG